MRTSPKRTWPALLVCLAILATAPVALPVEQEQSEELQIVVAAQALLQEGKFDEVLVEVAKALAIDDNLWQAYWLGGYAYQSKQSFAEAYEYFVKVTELNPGYGPAQRRASITAADIGDLDASWDHAIKAHQSGTDMSDAFAGLQTVTEAPDDLEAQLAVFRVFVGPFDTTVFEESGDRALSGGANSAATGRTGVGKRVVQEASMEIRNYQQQARKQFSDSRSFGLVQQAGLAQYIFVTEVDSLSDNISRRRMRGYASLVDAQSGEEVYRRRLDFGNIVSPGDLNRDFTELMKFIEEWAAEQQR